VENPWIRFVLVLVLVLLLDFAGISRTRTTMRTRRMAALGIFHTSSERRAPLPTNMGMHLIREDPAFWSSQETANVLVMTVSEYQM
jgi:hypothetical protein